MADLDETIKSARFDVFDLVKEFPENADTLLVDRYLVSRQTASARIFRVYRGTPPHYHEQCDEFLYVLSGRGTFWMETPENGGEFAPGSFLFFRKHTIHALPEILEGPVEFLSIDTPRRDPKDIHFVNPEDGTPESFIQAVK
ncbi:cupin domain-containing protein [Acidicapsa ligni]|uniref:cupin domain-containing protein n=1 Tax=Acidicapsa ligni TaxID=542300 RepID=UPI0021E0136E|nr:cupin domain-containing protein [Acidicapsa ligni]